MVVVMVVDVDLVFVVFCCCVNFFLFTPPLEKKFRWWRINFTRDWWIIISSVLFVYMYRLVAWLV